MVLQIFFAISHSSPLNDSVGSSSFMLLLLTSLFSATYLSNKNLHKLKRRAKWQFLKNFFKSFFKKKSNGFIGSLKFWLIVAGGFLALCFILSLGAALLITGLALLVYVIVANKKPSY